MKTHLVGLKSLFSVELRALADALWLYFGNYAVVEANRRLDDVLPINTILPKIRPRVLRKRLAAVAYWKEGPKLAAIAVFTDEWKGRDRKALLQFCAQVDVLPILVEKQAAYSQHLLNTVIRAQKLGFPAEDATSVILDARCPLCDAALIARREWSTEKRCIEPFFECSNRVEESEVVGQCTGSRCKPEELVLYMSNTALAKKLHVPGYD